MDSNLLGQQPINQKLTFDDEPDEKLEKAKSDLPANNAAKKKTPIKRASTDGNTRKSPSKTRKLKDYFTVLSSCPSEPQQQTSNTTETDPTTSQTTDKLQNLVPNEAESSLTQSSSTIATNVLEQCLADKSNSNDSLQDKSATPKANEDVKTATTFEGVFATPCHRPPLDKAFGEPCSEYKTPIASSLKKKPIGEGILNSSVKKSV